QVAHELAREHRVEVAAMNFAAPQKRGRFPVLYGNMTAPSYASHEDGPVAVHSLSPSPFDRMRMLPIAVRVLPKMQRLAYHPANRFGYRFFRAVYVRRLKQLMRRT